MVNLKIDIPNGFLDEEVRCGYTVSSQMKEVWSVQLDLFAEFDRVCKKHDIKYVASGGTMLGAVRHHGYIPWDDDMDLMMMRDQYEKLCRVAPVEFKHPYFFQTEDTEPTARRWFARLCNSETTGIQKKYLNYHLQRNQGIFIDIFPMDNVADDKRVYQRQLEKFMKCTKLYYRLFAIEYSYWPDNDSIIKKIIKQSAHFILGNLIHSTGLTHKMYKKVEDICKLNNCCKTELVSLLSFQYMNLGHAIHTTDMDNLIYLDFEFMKMPVIANYDEHLHRKYGDYMKPNHNPNFHGDVIFDTSTSYKEYSKSHALNRQK